MASISEEFQDIKDRLSEQGLFHEGTLVMVAGEGATVVFDAEGVLTSSDLFARVRAPYAVFTFGSYGKKFAATGRALKASSDDMAQLLGYRVRNVRKPGGAGPAWILRDRGFVVTGRYVGELVAGAILLEKACRAEVLAPHIGKLTYLNPALCAIEHAVYLASYSKHEKEAADGDS